MPQVLIRHSHPPDWPSICEIHDLARAIEIGGFVPRDAIVPMKIAAQEEGFFDCQTFVACLETAGGPVAGFISIRPPELTWCYVHPSSHRQGIGRKLVEHVLPKLGPDAFVLTSAENPGGLQFYQSLGFVIAARFPGEAHGHRCQCVRLTLPNSRHRHRPPTPSKSALRLAGFTDASPGNAYLGNDGVYYWR